MLSRLSKTLPTHPTLTWPDGRPVRAIGVSNRTGRLIWPVHGGADPTPEEKAAADKAAAASTAAEEARKAADAEAARKAAEEGEKGFPENTPVAEMTDKQAAAYWKYQSRKHENTAKSRADYDDLKAKAAEADKLRKERETDNEKAVREASEKAASEERARNAPRLVGAEFRAAAKGVLTDEQTAALIEDLDLTKYLDDKGEVDVDKVEKKVKTFAPDTTGRRTPDLGQGRRAGGVTTRGARGLAEAERRFPKPAAAKQ